MHRDGWKDTCNYCGEKARAWQGDAAWCGREPCNTKHDWATYEPNFLLRPLASTLWQRLDARIIHRFYRVLADVTPIQWVLPDYAGTRT
jgi:hypothetical protein